MSEPVSLRSTTTHHSLPFLFAGQAQKEFTVNEALARIDVLLHTHILGFVSSEPQDSEQGDTFIVSGPAAGAFAGREDSIASWDGHQWTFLLPSPGMQVRDSSTGTFRIYDNSWRDAPHIPAPSGGVTVDAEARGAITALVTALRNYGIISGE